MIEPHGGELVNRIEDQGSSDSPRITAGGQSIQLDRTTYQSTINISNGRYSPLTGYLSQRDLLQVCEVMALEDGTVWPLPITLDISEEKASELTPGTRAELVNPAGETIGSIDIHDVYTYDEKWIAQQIFGTKDTAHPGVRALFDKEEFLVGGDISVFEKVRYNDTDLFPRETRVLFEEQGWETVVGFQTRNAPHRAHEYIQKSVLELMDGLLVQPKLGDKKVNDYRDDVIIRAYEVLFREYYPDENVALTSFPSTMRYAGPREAIFDAIVRKNQGCTHFVVGRDHAGVQDFYDDVAAQLVFEEIPDIGIDIIHFDYSFYCYRCDGMASEKTCCHNSADRVEPSGSRVREQIRKGKRPSDKLIRPEVADVIMESDAPFITGESVVSK